MRQESIDKCETVTRLIQDEKMNQGDACTQQKVSALTYRRYLKELGKGEKKPKKPKYQPIVIPSEVPSTLTISGSGRELGEFLLTLNKGVQR